MNSCFRNENCETGFHESIEACTDRGLKPPRFRERRQKIDPAAAMNTGGAILHMDDVEAQEHTSFGECAPPRQVVYYRIAPARRAFDVFATNYTSLFHSLTFTFCLRSYEVYICRLFDIIVLLELTCPLGRRWLWGTRQSAVLLARFSS